MRNDKMNGSEVLFLVIVIIAALMLKAAAWSKTAKAPIILEVSDYKYTEEVDK